MLGTGVGALIIFLNVDRALALFGVDASIGFAIRIVVMIVAIVVVGLLFQRARSKAAAAAATG